MSILIDENTTFIVQGITGREAVNLTRECLDYGKGAKIVGGVTPGRRGPTVPGSTFWSAFTGLLVALGVLFRFRERTQNAPAAPAGPAPAPVPPTH